MISFPAGTWTRGPFCVLTPIGGPGVQGLIQTVAVDGSGSAEILFGADVLFTFVCADSSG